MIDHNKLQILIEPTQENLQWQIRYERRENKSQQIDIFAFLAKEVFFVCKVLRPSVLSKAMHVTRLNSISEMDHVYC